MMPGVRSLAAAGFAQLALCAVGLAAPAAARVPEPGTLVLMGVGLLVLAWAVRRRRRAARRPPERRMRREDRTDFR